MNNKKPPDREIVKRKRRYTPSRGRVKKRIKVIIKNGDVNELEFLEDETLKRNHGKKVRQKSNKLQ